MSADGAAEAKATRLEKAARNNMPDAMKLLDDAVRVNVLRRYIQ